MTPQVLVALLAVAVGWLLSEVSHRLRRRDDRTAAAGKALTELLEIRHYLLGINLVFCEIRRHVQLSPGEVLTGMKWIDQLLPPDPRLPERYEQAVSALAGASPIAAFHLRSKDQLPQLLVKMRSIQLVDPGYPDLLYSTDEFLRDRGLAALDESIRELAWIHGMRTWLRIRRLLGRTPQLPLELAEFMDRFNASVVPVKAGPTA